MRGGLMREMAFRSKSATRRGPSLPTPSPLCAALMADDAPVLFVPVGDNPARPFGMDANDRACRLATNAGLECADATQPGRAALLASMTYGWDPAWLKEMRNRPRTVLTLGGKPVMAHVPAGEDAPGFDRGQFPQGYE